MATGDPYTDAVLNAQAIGNACCGSQGTRALVCDSDAVGALVSHWLPRSTSDAVLNAQAIGNACYGLQGMRDY